LTRLIKLVVFVTVAWLSFKYHMKHDTATTTATAAPGRDHADGEYSSPAAQSQPHLIVYGIQCVATRKYTGMLDQNRIPYLYKDINQTIKSPQWTQDIVPRMALSGIKPDDLKGPLVDINGRLYATPDIQTIRDQLNH